METEFILGLANEKEAPPVCCKPACEEKSVGNEKAASSLGPITPDPIRETGDFPIDLSSPLTTLVTSPDDISISSPHTPADCEFDPFAPGPEKLQLAPSCRKIRGPSQFNVVRQLKFDLFRESDDVKAAAVSSGDEEVLLETVYDSLLEAIVSKQQSDEEKNVTITDEVCKTPDSAKFLTGVADTCPDAPFKSYRISRNIDRSLCRKLEF